MTWRTAVSHEGDQAVVTVVGEIDMVTEGHLREAVDDALRHDPTPIRLIVDLSQVDFLDSAGIRALLLSHGQAAKQGTELRVCAPKPTVATVLQVTRVNDLLGLPLPPASHRPRGSR